MKINPQKLLARAQRMLKNGDSEEAKKTYLAVLETYPKSLVAKKGLKNLEKNINLKSQESISSAQLNSVYLLYSSGKTQETIDKINGLHEYNPSTPILFNILGACYESLGQLENSIKAFETAVATNPNYDEAHYNLGVVLKRAGRLSDAIKSYKNAIKIKPNYPQAHNNLGTALKDDGQLEAAIESYEWAIAYKSDFAESHNNLGNALIDCGNLDDAIKSYEKSTVINSKYAEPYNNLGNAFKQLGQLDDAIKNYEMALMINPKFVEAHLELSRIKKYKKNEPQIATMQSMLAEENLSLINRIGINFALAHAYESLKNQDDQFKFLNEANSLRKKELNYSFSKDQKLFSNIRDSFKLPYILVKKSLLTPTTIKPIFVVGMPRSGTSLVEQIIDSHHDAYGAGELNTINKFIFPLLSKHSNFSEKDLLSLRQNYLDYLSILNTPERIIIDKMPLNFRYIGFILSAFPEAKIVHLKRDAMATCWSIYKYYFNGNEYSYNLKDLANYYLLYQGLMDFWHQLFPNKIFDICYEDLTINQEEETQKILKYCELDWDENCLNFYKSKRAVKTTSTFQVRQKIYQGSSEAWKKHEAYLKPLLKGLNY
jgi:tetratricopeptide (TPR) repeat protein